MKPGDIIMVRDGKSILAKAIMLCMRIYKQKNHINIKENYHHSGRVIELWGVLHIAEANAPGFQIQKLNVAYTEWDWENRIDLFEPVLPYTEWEREEICKKCVEYSTKVTRYDFLNFFYHLRYIIKGTWEGPVGDKAKHRFYCSEAVATVENDIRPNSFKEPSSVNPIDIVNSNLYKLSRHDKGRNGICV